MSETQGRPDGAGLYRWSAWFDGLALTRASDGTTALRGEVAHQPPTHHTPPGRPT